MKMMTKRNLIFLVFIALTEALAEAIFPPEALPQKSGYIEVNQSSGSKMFFAYYEAQSKIHRYQLQQRRQDEAHEIPIIIWLQGGPGCSSMAGNFYEIGPWLISPDDLELHLNPYSWNQRFGLLFFDNPVGTGFSIAPRDEDIPRDQEQVSDHLYRAIQKFRHEIMPENSQRVFFVAGESYAGKYVPALAYRILTQNGAMNSQRNRNAEPLPIKLGGILIGDGLTDPEMQVQTHGDVAHSFGLIDAKQRNYVEEQALKVVSHIHNKDWRKASKARTSLLDWIEKISGIATCLDIRRSVPYHSLPGGQDFLSMYLNQRWVKSVLNAHPDAQWVACNKRVSEAMEEDKMKSVKWMLQAVLQELPVLVFQGQYDIKDGFVSNEKWLSTMEWDAIQGFLDAERRIWIVQEKPVGYWKCFSNLTHVVFRDAGHMVPVDQGYNSLVMVETWVSQQLSRFQPFASDS